MDQEETVEEIKKEKKFHCWICNDADFDTNQKLGAHQGHCKLAHPNYKERTERVPFGSPQQRFILPKEDREKYQYRVFNDNWRKEPGRIQRAKTAGYEFVDHDRSGESVGANDDGSEIKGVLMRIPKELYDEDQALKQREIDKVDAQIHRGKFQQGSSNDHRYLPGRGIQTEIKQKG